MTDQITTMGPPILTPTLDAVRRNYSSTISNVRGSVPAIPDYGMTQTFNQQMSMAPPMSLGPQMPMNSQMANSKYLARSLMGPQQSTVSTFKTRAPINEILGTPPPPMPMQIDGQSQFQRSLVSGEPINAYSLRQDRMMMNSARNFGFEQDQLKSENSALRAEVHRLRKIEAGWFPGANEDQTKVTIVNNYQSQINQYIDEINNLKSNLQTFESENLNLREQLKMAVNNPDVNRKLREMNLSIERLTAENRNLRASASNSAVEMERNYAQQLETLRRQKNDLENELRTAQSQISQRQELIARAGVEERQKASSIIDSHRVNNQKLQEEVNFLKGEVRRLSNTPPVQMNDPRVGSLNDQIRSLRDQLSSANAELEKKNTLVYQLESRVSTGPIVQTVVDDAAVRDRESLLQQYKMKWDEVGAENNRLKSQIASYLDEIQRLKIRSDTSVVAASSVVSTKRDQALIDALRLETQTAKDDANHYRLECQRLRDQLREVSQKVSRTEIHREVIYDKTGNYPSRISSSPEPRVISTTVRPATESYVTTTGRTQSYSIPASRTYSSSNYSPGVTYSTRTNYSPNYEYTSTYDTKPATTYAGTTTTYVPTTTTYVPATTTYPTTTYTTTTSSQNYPSAPSYTAAQTYDSGQSIQTGSHYGSADNFNQNLITEPTLPLNDAGRVVLNKNEMIGDVRPMDQVTTNTSGGNVFIEKTSDTISFGRS